MSEHYQHQSHNVNLVNHVVLPYGVNLLHNKSDIHDQPFGLPGGVQVDMSEKARLEHEENAIFMQYLTGGVDGGENISKEQHGSGSDTDDSDDEDNVVAPLQQHHLQQQLQQQQQQQLQQQHQLAHQQHLQHQQQVHLQHQAHVQQQQQQHQQQHQHMNYHHQYAAMNHNMVGGGMHGNNPAIMMGVPSVLQQQQLQSDKVHAVQDRSLDSLVFREEPGVVYGAKGRLKWTPQMDRLLKEGYEKHTGHGVGMWKKVAEYVTAGMGAAPGVISNHQCGERYKHHLDPALDTRKAGPWTDDDVENLRRLVSENTSREDPGSGKKPVINWVKIAIMLNRHYRDCQHKWINMVKAELKTGVFTREEEEIVLQRVHEWGDQGRGKGVWIALEKELGRRNRSILDKYKRLVRKNKAAH